MSIDVFVSVGRTSTPVQENFVSAVEQHLRNNGLSPRCLGRNDFSSEQPLKAVSNLMDQCCGTFVIAFERTYFEKALEYRNSKNEKTISQQGLPTVWNQIEATMAYDRKQPLLVVIETGLKSEGLLESGYDWFVQWIPILDSPLSNREFLGVFADWKTRVENYRETKERNAAEVAATIDYSTVSIGKIISSLKPGQFWAAVAAIVAALAGVAAIAFKLGSLVIGKP